MAKAEGEEKHPFPARLPKPLYARLSESAGANRRSVNRELEVAVEFYLAAQDKRRKPKAEGEQ